MNQATHRRFYIYVIIFVLACIIRIAFMIQNPVRVRDSFEYRNVLENKEKVVFDKNHVYPPLAMYIIGLPGMITKCNTIKGGCVIDNVLGLMIVLTIMLIAQEFTKSLLNLFCIGLLAATHESLVEYSCEMLRENSFLIFCSIGVLCMVRAIKRRSYLYHVLCGVFFSLGVMCRYEALEFSAIYLITVYLLQRNLKRTIKSTLCFAISFLIVFGIVYLTLDNQKEYMLLYLNTIYERFHC